MCALFPSTFVRGSSLASPKKSASTSYLFVNPSIVNCAGIKIWNWKTLAFTENATNCLVINVKKHLFCREISTEQMALVRFLSQYSWPSQMDQTITIFHEFLTLFSTIWSRERGQSMHTLSGESNTVALSVGHNIGFISRLRWTQSSYSRNRA